MQKDYNCNVFGKIDLKEIQKNEQSYRVPLFLWMQLKH